MRKYFLGMFCLSCICCKEDSKLPISHRGGMTAVVDGDIYFASYFYRKGTDLRSPLFIYSKNTDYDPSDEWHPFSSAEGDDYLVRHFEFFHPLVEKQKKVVLYDDSKITMSVMNGTDLSLLR